MDMFALSQKQKMVMFLVILMLGFASLAFFSSHRLDQMKNQYHSSANIASGSLSIYQTQAEILTLTSHLAVLASGDVEYTKATIADISVRIGENSSFLKMLGFAEQATQLSSRVTEFNGAITPWLSIKQELGFSIDEGKLGRLKLLAGTIEKKIAETGMVTLNSDFQAMIKTQQNYLLQPTAENLKKFNRAMASFENMSNVYAMLDLYEKEIGEFKETFVRVSELSQQLNDAEHKLLNTEEAMKSLISDITQQLSGVGKEYQSSAMRASDQTMFSILVACVALAVFTLVIFILQSTSLSRSINRTKEVLEKISQGDLSNRMEQSSNRNDEFNQLAMSINQSCENLGGLVLQVQDSSGDLSITAVRLNQGLDKQAESQSEVLGQTQLLASATEQVSVTTNEVSSSLEIVAEISRSSTQSAEEGAKVIGSAIGALEEVSAILTSAANHTQQLEDASSKVDSVMEIINGIAEQTNLLALNAAIEAARAGEQGRGFAVVADEVRSLAVRTVDAVSEISETIDTMKNESAEVIVYISQSESSIASGKERGIEAIKALNTIISKTDEASNQTEVIFNSIKELATTSQSMAGSMTQISSAMQGLEDNNEQLRVISSSVKSRANSLNEDCQKFTVSLEKRE